MTSQPTDSRWPDPTPVTVPDAATVRELVALAEELARAAGHLVRDGRPGDMARLRLTQALVGRIHAVICSMRVRTREPDVSR